MQCKSELERLRRNLRSLFDAYIEATGSTVSSVGKRLMGNSTIDRMLYSPHADIKAGTYDRAVQAFSDHWPKGVAWPADVHRPEPQPLETSSAS